MKTKIMRALAIVLVIGMLLPLTAFAAKGYSVTLTVEGPDKSGVTQSITASTDRYGKESDPVIPAIATLITANYSAIENVFDGTGLGPVLKKGSAVTNETDWTSFVAAYAFSGDETFNDFGVTFADLEEGKDYVLTYNDYTLTVTLNVYSPASGGTVVSEITPAVDDAYTAAAKEAAACKDDDNCIDRVYKDVTASWYHDGIHFCVASKLMIGIAPDAFAPEMDVTRAQIATILYRIAGEPVAIAAKQFTDVPSTAWFAQQVAWATRNNLIDGNEDGTFGPNVAMTREEIVETLYRYAKLAKKDVSAAKTTDLKSFPDAADVSASAVEAFQYACGKGIIIGNEGKLLPKSNVTRAEVATIIFRFVTL